MYMVYVKAMSNAQAEEVAQAAIKGGVEIFFTSELKQNSNIAKKLNQIDHVAYLDRSAQNWNIISDKRTVIGEVKRYITREDKIKSFLENE